MNTAAPRRESHFARNIATGEERGDTCTALIALSGRYLPNRFLPSVFLSLSVPGGGYLVDLRQPLILLFTILDRKGTGIDKWYPFHIPTVV